MQTAQTAAYRQLTESSARTNPDTFGYKVGVFAHELRNTQADLNDAEKRLCEDYARGASESGDARYRMITFLRLMAIARRSRRPEIRERLAEIVREECHSGVAPTPIEIAFDQETGAVGPCDVAQRQFERTPTPMTWKACKNLLARQLATTKAAYDAVLGWRGANQ